MARKDIQVPFILLILFYFNFSSKFLLAKALKSYRQANFNFYVYFERECTSRAGAEMGELAHVVRDQEVPPSANWRTCKASGVTQSETESLKIRGADGVSPSVRPKA